MLTARLTLENIGEQTKLAAPPTRVCVYLWVHVCIHVWICVCVCIHVSTRVSASMCLSVCTHVFTCVSVFIRVHVSVCACGTPTSPEDQAPRPDHLQTRTSHNPPEEAHGAAGSAGLGRRAGPFHVKWRDTRNSPAPHAFTPPPRTGLSSTVQADRELHVSLFLFSFLRENNSLLCVFKNHAVEQNVKLHDF